MRSRVWSCHTVSPGALRAARGRWAGALLFAVAAIACGDGSSPADAAAPGDGSGVPGANDCDPAAQDCPAGQRCDYVCASGAVAFRCIPVPSPTAAPGEACRVSTPGVAGTAPMCDRGSTCLGAATTDLVCYPFCGPATPCRTGTCQPVDVSVNCGAGARRVQMMLCR